MIVQFSCFSPITQIFHAVGFRYSFKGLWHFFGFFHIATEHFCKYTIFYRTQRWWANQKNLRASFPECAYLMESFVNDDTDAAVDILCQYGKTEACSGTDELSVYYAENGRY